MTDIGIVKMIKGPDKKRPFMLFINGRFIGRFSTQQEAENFWESLKKGQIDNVSIGETIRTVFRNCIATSGTLLV